MITIRVDEDGGQSDGIFLRATCLLSALEAFWASTSNTASISSDTYISLTA